MLLFVNSTVYK